ncbi:MAG: tellurite resistance TerB family protein [Hyphomicrobiales bacterium]|nr:tellurite resistance TerB family protein [Hyphomicrobiales bacterium]
MSKLSYHNALIHIMVTMSAADRTMSDSELAKIGTIVKSLPVFAEFDTDKMIDAANDCTRILQQEDGLDQIIDNALECLPDHLRETAYAVAVDVAAADLQIEQEELRLLQIFRHRLDIDRLTAAAIERGARARHQTI